MTSPKRRIETDVMKLMSDYEVTLVNDNSNVCYLLATSSSKKLIIDRQEFYVRFKGPQNTPYAGGVWNVHVEIPDQYPYKSPSIGFMNRIYHPNVDELSGSVCLDVLNSHWSPMYEMFNIFEVFLPQLLSYPNAADPLNGDAASLYMRDKKAYDERVKEYVKNFAGAGAADKAVEQTEAEEEMSDAGSYHSDGEEEQATGEMDEL